MSDSETISVYNRQVKEYAELACEMKEQSDLDAFADQVPVGGYILDLGCGPGMASAYLLSQGFSIDAMDASQEMVRVAKSQYGVNARCAEFLDIASVDVYDGIWASFSLLHATPEEFPKILTALYQALKPNGIFHIGMKLGEGSGRDHLGRYYSYYSQQGLQAHLENAGFTVKDIKCGAGRGLAGTVDPYVWILSIADKDSIHGA